MGTSKDQSTQSALEPHDIIAPSLDARHARVRGFIEQLAEDPPQVVLFEGGTAEEREAVALYWAARINCLNSPAPCMDCSACRQMITKASRDLFFFDGRAGSIGYDGEPNATGTIKIEWIRELRTILGEPPRSERKRVVVLFEAQSLSIASANALLKSLEEPRPNTSFLLLAPQRERLLPTLVSRSWVVTLAWPVGDSSARSEEVREWADVLATFMVEGTGLLAKTGTRGALDATLAMQLLVHCQHELASAITGRKGGELARLFAQLDMGRQRKLDEVLSECQDSLNAPVSPPLVVDWLGTKMYLLAKFAAKSSGRTIR
ncbi:DNA polymerase III subunit delta' [Halodesulfovibrio sp.]|uniref:DNA polymerase III subunit delta' n=1 Tax=Halodesulfovibrio sp. TaxID=1912772 RepID=UPI0025D2E8DB|nr:DNA polymerase III subunit delta' [Halodesulfovibrio sp.]MCT4535640.1 DNA polymerase III subunit delta' [Halodesulfovibrio sp.]